MSASFDIFEKDGVLVIAILGDPTVEDIKRAISKTRDASGYRHMSRLWDFREAAFDFSMEELEEIASYASAADAAPARVAMLVGQDLSFGVSRMYGAYRENTLTEVKVFRHEPDALAWLHE